MTSCGLVLGHGEVPPKTGMPRVAPRQFMAYMLMCIAQYSSIHSMFGRA